MSKVNSIIPSRVHLLLISRLEAQVADYMYRLSCVRAALGMPPSPQFYKPVEVRDADDELFARIGKGRE